VLATDEDNAWPADQNQSGASSQNTTQEFAKQSQVDQKQPLQSDGLSASVARKKAEAKRHFKAGA